MKAIEISGQKREKSGTSEAVKSRRSGKIPCILYGGEENVKFLVEESSFKKLLYTHEIYEVKLSIDGNNHIAFLSSAQFHPVTDSLLHVDFIEAKEGKEISMKLPVKLKGTAIGVQNGGVLRFTRPSLQVKGLPKLFPDAFEIDIEQLDIGDSVKVGDIKTEGIQFLHSDNDVIVRISVARALIETEVEEEEEEVDLESMTEEERAEYNKQQAEKEESGTGETPADKDREKSQTDAKAD